MVVRLLRRLLAAQLFQQHGDGRHDGLGDLLEHVGSGLPVVELGEVDRRSGEHLEGLAREQLDLLLLGVGRHRQIGAPLGHRNDGGLGHQRHPRGAGLAGHRPHVRIAGEGAFRIKGHAFAALDRVHGGPECVQGVGGLAVDRDLAGAVQDRADNGDLEEGRLGEQSGHPAAVVLEVRVRERVQIRVVIDGRDKPAFGRNVIHSPPVPLEEHDQRRFCDDRRQAVPEADSAAGHSYTFLWDRCVGVPPGGSWGSLGTSSAGQVWPPVRSLSRTPYAPPGAPDLRVDRAEATMGRRMTRS